jgi:DNA-binding transcriptional LysR family regulator
MSMDSAALHTFVAVARAGGFSAAGDALLRSQPAISRRIAQLEAELGAALFDRGSGGVVLSDAGRALLPHAERVLAALDDADAAMGEFKAAPDGRVELAVVGTLAGAELTRPLRRFMARHPKAQVGLSTGTSAVVSERVRRGEASLGVRYHADPSDDLVSRPLGSERAMVACAADHPLAGRRIGGLAELAGAPWFAFPNTYAWRETTAANIFAQFAVRGTPQIAWTPVDSLQAQKRLIEAGLGLALLPASNMAEERAAGTLAVIEVADLDLATPVVAVTRRGGYLSRAASALLELLEAELTAALD